MEVADRISQNPGAELVEKLRSGNSAAIEELYNTYRSRLYYLVLGHVNGRQDVAEDIVGEIFLAAIDSLDKFQGNSQLYTWLCSIAFHKISDFHRRQKREAKSVTLVPDADIDAIKPRRDRDTDPTAVSMMEAEESRHTVQQALVDLPSIYQQVLVFKYVKEMPVQEISQVMGRSPKSVEGLLSRARKALRSNLAEAV